MVKRLKVITQQPKAIENPNIDIKSVTIKHLKISRNLSKIKACEKTLPSRWFWKNSTGFLHNQKTNIKYFFNETKTKKQKSKRKQK